MKAATRTDRDSPEPAKSRGAATRRRILTAAKELFLGGGYSRTSLEQVAERAGVTKPTVYSHFGTKKGLLLALAHSHFSELVDSFASMLRATGDHRADLLRFSEAFLEGVMSQESILWRRLVVMESVQHPQLGQSLVEAGPKKVLCSLSAFIQQAIDEGKLQCADAGLAAEQFLGLLVGLHPILTMVGQPPPSKAQQRERCFSAVEVFLNAYGRKDL